MRFIQLIICIGLFILFTSGRSSNLKYTDSEIKAAYIAQIIEYIKWPDEKRSNVYRIGFFGEEEAIFTALTVIAEKSKTEKDIQVIKINQLEEIALHELKVLFIAKNKINRLKEIYYKVYDQQMLIISDHADQKIYTMINLILTADEKIQFEVNRKNIEDNGMQILPKLLLIGGTELDVQMLFNLKERELELEKERVISQELTLRELEHRIEEQKNLIIEQDKDILDQNEKFKLQEQRILEQETVLNELTADAILQKNIIKEKEQTISYHRNRIEQQEKLISKYNEEIAQGREALENQTQLIDEGIKKIEEQKKALFFLEDKVRLQRIYLVLAAIIIALVIFIIYYMYKNVKFKQFINTQLKENYEELSRREEELSHLNNELNSTNEELSQQKQELENTIFLLKETQSQLIQSEKMAALGTLTAGIAHEINNPLNFIQSGIHALYVLIEDLDETQKTELHFPMQSIETGVRRTSEIIKSLNRFNRTTSNNNELCDMHIIIDDCLLMLDSSIKNRINVFKDFTTHHYNLTGNEGRLHQVFLNILTNSVQAIENKGDINIITRIEKSSFEVSIRDSGSGIDEKHLNKITDPFFTTKDPGQGTGLGLSIAYTIIKEHGGDIQFDSEKGKGTTVKIWFPIEKNA